MRTKTLKQFCVCESFGTLEWTQARFEKLPQMNWIFSNSHVATVTQSLYTLCFGVRDGFCTSWVLFPGFKTSLCDPLSCFACWPHSTKWCVRRSVSKLKSAIVSSRYLIFVAWAPTFGYNCWQFLVARCKVTTGWSQSSGSELFFLNPQAISGSLAGQGLAHDGSSRSACPKEPGW